MSFVSLAGVSCAAPDSKILFSGLDLSIGNEVVGLVGRNGCGKSTLLSAICGGAPPASGTITCTGKIGVLRQLPQARISVADAMGAASALARLARIETGGGDDEDFERADWSLPARLEKALAQADLPPLDPQRQISTLSGGERMRLMIAAMLLPQPDLLLLDEPTNNLDAAGRGALMQLLSGWHGGALIASHDRALLEHMDRIAELTPAGVHIVSGGWSAFDQIRSAERERRQQDLAKSARELDQARREAQREAEKKARRDKRGRLARTKGGEPKILLDARKETAENTARRIGNTGAELVTRAQTQLANAREAQERVTPMRIDLPASGLSSTHILLRAKGLSCRRGNRQLFANLDITVRGPERIALEGPNGSGKTSLLRLLTSGSHREAAPQAAPVFADHARIAVLDQHLSLLSSGASAIEEMSRHNPSLNENALHEALAAFGFRNIWAQRLVSSLSGGEKVRLALACLFARPTPPQLLMLDEPTNHLDLAATQMLEQALANWDGAILCISHDAAFMDAIGPTRRIVLGA